MSKTIRISLYVIILLIGYFFVATTLKSCKSKSSDEKVEQLDGDMTTTEEDDFFEDFNDSTEDSSLNNLTEEPDEIDYKALDEKLKGENQEENQHVNKEEKTYSKPEKRQTPMSKPMSGGGKYLVVAGSYLVEGNAQNMVSKLKRMGYGDAEVVIFDLSKYYTVIADRMDSRSDASSTVGALKNKGIDCYLHTKQ